MELGRLMRLSRIQTGRPQLENKGREGSRKSGVDYHDKRVGAMAVFWRLAAAELMRMGSCYALSRMQVVCMRDRDGWAKSLAKIRGSERLPFALTRRNEGRGVNLMYDAL